MWNIDRIINQLGEGNAQLFRELKGRATGRNLLLAVGCSVASQVLLLLAFMSQFPTNPVPGSERSSQTYCVLETIKRSNANSSGFYEQQVCQLNALGQVSIDWPDWWADILMTMSWLLPLTLITGSVYFLANDLRREDKRGTLNFLRLSPQSAPEIFIGKLLGVPILVYLAVALALPLHLLAALSSGLGPLDAIAWYVLMVAIAGVFAIGAMLLTLASPSMPIAITGIALWFTSTALSLTNWLLHDALHPQVDRLGSNDIFWFYLAITQSASFCYLFGIANCLMAIYWLWQTICRRYLSPRSTLLSKKSSYQLNLCCQLWLVGFGLPLFTGRYRYTGFSDLTAFLGGVAVAQILAALVTTAALTPQRQAVQDWSRYRRASSRKKFWQQEIWADLLWHDQSPSVLALAANLAIALVVWLPWCPFAFNSGAMVIKAMVAAVVTALVLLNYGLLVQIWMATKKKWQWQQASGLLTLAIVLPSIGAVLLAVVGLQPMAIVMTAVLSPFAVFGIEKLALFELVLGVVGQSLLAVLIATRLRRQIQKIGQSEMQAALSAA